MTTWKFGCNWGGHPNHFYDFIQNESIVLGWEPDTPYNVDDLVLVTRGFKGLAIAEVLYKPEPISNVADYAAVQGQFGIAYNDPRSIYAKAEWYELPAPIIYRCQRGSGRIHKPEILAQIAAAWQQHR